MDSRAPEVPRAKARQVICNSSSALEFVDLIHILDDMSTHTSTPPSQRLPSRLASLATLAALLERLEQQPSSASADQYRQVAQQIAALLANAEPDPFLDALLAAAPASAQIYENLRYENAGLCREPLEKSLNAELAARELIAKVRRTAASR